VRILGVDPGSRAAGWALVTFAPAPALEAAGVLRPPAGLDFAGRLRFLRDGLAAVLRERRPDAACVERVFAGVNPQSLITLGAARGVLVLALAEAGVPVAEGFRKTGPFIIPLVVTLLLITYIPGFVLWLPRLLFG